MASPVSAFHGNPHTDMIGWLYNYRIATPGTDTADNTTIRLDVRNVPQPDAVLYTLAESWRTRPDFGRRVHRRGTRPGRRDRQTSASKDLGPKMTAYARNGIAEYIVWRTHDGVMEWFVLRSGVYVPLQPGCEWRNPE